MATPAAVSFMPAYLSPAAAQIDRTTYNQIEGILARVNAIRTKLNDHRTLAGAEAYGTSIAFYALESCGGGGHSRCEGHCGRAESAV